MASSSNCALHWFLRNLTGQGCYNRLMIRLSLPLSNVLISRGHLTGLTALALAQ